MCHERGATHEPEHVRRRKSLGSYVRANGAVFGATHVPDQPPRAALRARGADLVLAQVSNARSHHVAGTEVAAQQHVGHCAQLHRGIPTIHVIARIRLRDAERLCVRDAVRHSAAELDGFENDSRRRGEHAAHRREPTQRQAVAHEREEWRAIHHRGLEPVGATRLGCQCGECAIPVHHRPLVRRDRVGAVPKRAGQVAERGLTRVRFECDGFEHDVSARCRQPCVDVGADSGSGVIGVQSLRVRPPSRPAGRDSTDHKRDTVLRCERRTVALEQFVQCTADGAVAQQGEAKGIHSWRSIVRRPQVRQPTRGVAARRRNQSCVPPR